MMTNTHPPAKPSPQTRAWDEDLVTLLYNSPAVGLYCCFKQILCVPNPYSIHDKYNSPAVGLYCRFKQILCVPHPYSIHDK